MSATISTRQALEGFRRTARTADGLPRHPRHLRPAARRPSSAPDASERRDLVNGERVVVTLRRSTTNPASHHPDVQRLAGAAVGRRLHAAPPPARAAAFKGGQVGFEMAACRVVQRRAARSTMAPRCRWSGPGRVASAAGRRPLARHTRPPPAALPPRSGGASSAGAPGGRLRRSTAAVDAYACSSDVAICVVAKPAPYGSRSSTRAAQTPCGTRRRRGACEPGEGAVRGLRRVGRGRPHTCPGIPALLKQVWVGLRPVGSADKSGAAEERWLGTEVDSRLSTAQARWLGAMSGRR